MFCGPGGLSEGFRLAGFRIVFGLDKSRDAVATFRINHPEAEAVVGDASDVDPWSLPEFDILIGGPPCVNFSHSKGGRANVLEGLRLVQAFLRVVHVRQPRYWVMENVPRVARHLPDRIPLRWIGIEEEGFLEVPVRHEFATADYGIPQRRNRYLIGRYPVPPPSGRESPTLGEVLATFPNPHRKPAGSGPSRRVRDVNYGFSIPGSELADHHHPVSLTEAEVDRIREVKTAHPYMGRMAFPDRLDRPARTVVATQLGRETLVVGDESPGSTGFRRLTVRECATLQTFPVTYRFAGRTLASRYRQAGDAVPPRFSYEIASAIRFAEGMPVLAGPQRAPQRETPPPAAVTVSRAAGTAVLPWTKRFSRLVPGKEVRGCRVEFGNGDVAKEGPGAESRWRATLFVGELKGKIRSEEIGVEAALAELAGLASWSAGLEMPRLVAFVRALERDLQSVEAGGDRWQRIHTRREPGIGPRAWTERVSACVEAHFPAAEWGRRRVPRSGMIGIVPEGGWRVRLAAGAVAAAFTAEKVAGIRPVEELARRLERVQGACEEEGAELWSRDWRQAG